MAHVMTRRTKFILDEDRIPRAWYNIAADLPVPPPPSSTPAPASRSARTTSRRSFRWRSSSRRSARSARSRSRSRSARPTRCGGRARSTAPIGSRRALDTPAHIYYKYEGVSPAGSHKPNTALAAGLLQQGGGRHAAGDRDRAPASGAARWRSPAPTSGSRSRSTWSGASYDQKPYRRILMETYGAEVVPSPSPTTNYGRSVLAETPDTPARWASRSARRSRTRRPARTPSTRSARCSTTCCCTRRSSARRRSSRWGWPASSRTSSSAAPAAARTSRASPSRSSGATSAEGAKHRIIAVEPRRRPSLTRGVYAYDFGDTAKMTPLVKMHTLGHDFIPEPIHAGGLRYHGMAPLVSLLKEHGYIEARSVHQRASFEAGVQFARAEGILPAPEPTPRDQGRDRRGARGQGGGRGAGDPVQPLRPRPLRPVGLRALPGGSLEDYEYPAERVEAALEEPAEGLSSADANGPGSHAGPCGAA